MTKSKLLIPFGIAIFAVAGLLLNSGGFTTVTQANKLTESPFMLGHIELIAKDNNGNIKAYRQTDNLVVNTGKSCAAVHIFGVPTNSTQSTACGGQTAAAFNAIGIGTATAVAAGDTALGAQVGSRAQNNGTSSASLINATTPSTPYYSLQDQFRPGVSTIAESGIFDQVATGTGSHMFAHQTFTGITLGATDTLTVTWRVTLS